MRAALMEHSDGLSIHAGGALSKEGSRGPPGRVCVLVTSGHSPDVLFDLNKEACAQQNLSFVHFKIIKS